LKWALKQKTVAKTRNQQQNHGRTFIFKILSPPSKYPKQRNPQQPVIVRLSQRTHGH